MTNAPARADAVLVTGVYGAGKSTVVADIGALLGDRGEHYGLLDVDWLGWFDSGISHQAHRRAVLGNLATVSSGFVIAGVRRLALAWSVRDRDQLDEVWLALPVPLRVVRLEVPAALVEQRLSADPTEERRGDDLLSEGYDTASPKIDVTVLPGIGSLSVVREQSRRNPSR